MCAGVWARTAGGRRSGSVSKRENLPYSLGGGGDVLAFIFRPGGLNQTIRPVASADNMTINQCAPGFGLKQPGDGMAASFFKGDFGLLTRRIGVTIYCYVINFIVTR